MKYEHVYYCVVRYNLDILDCDRKISWILLIVLLLNLEAKLGLQETDQAIFFMKIGFFLQEVQLEGLRLLVRASHG
jgi:hypothetical protein